MKKRKGLISNSSSTNFYVYDPNDTFIEKVRESKKLNTNAREIQRDEICFHSYGCDQIDTCKAFDPNETESEKILRSLMCHHAKSSDPLIQFFNDHSFKECRKIDIDNNDRRIKKLFAKLVKNSKIIAYDIENDVKVLPTDSARYDSYD